MMVMVTHGDDENEDDLCLHNNAGKNYMAEEIFRYMSTSFV